MCFCTLGNIFDVGAKDTVQGGDVRAVGTVVQKDVGAFGTVDKKEVVASGTVRKNWVLPREGFCFCCQSSVVSYQSRSESKRSCVGGWGWPFCRGHPPLPRVCRFTPTRAYLGWCRSVRHGVRSRGAEETSPVHLGIGTSLFLSRNALPTVFYLCFPDHITHQTVFSHIPGG